jgi:RecG-like helicase
LVGTPALFLEDVIFYSLGLPVLDEPPRFGVLPRFSLLDEGGTESQSPHQLIMTATPIPRPLAMTVYGSLETSIIDEMPPGRKPVDPTARPNSLREKVIKRIEEVCLSGQRVYWVCTLIEESAELEAPSAAPLYKEISETLPQIDVGLVRGKHRKKAKDRVIKKSEREEYNY